MKKTMKTLAIALAALLLFCGMTPAFAADIPETKVMLGDLSGDRKLTAGDARTLLRLSAKQIEGDYPIELCDVDGNGKITAADARTLLRCCAKLQMMNRGFDADGNPNVFALLKSNNYTLTTAMEDLSFSISRSGSKLFLDGSAFIGDLGEVASWFGDMGILIDGKDLYLLFTDNARFFSTSQSLTLKKYWAVTDEMATQMGMDEDLTGFIGGITDTFDLISDAIDKGTPEAELVEDETGEKLIRYTFSGSDAWAVTDLSGALRDISISDPEGTGEALGFPIGSITSDIPAESLSIADREAIDLTPFMKMME